MAQLENRTSVQPAIGRRSGTSRVHPRKGFACARGLNIECGWGGGLVFLTYILNLTQGILTNLVLLGLPWVGGRPYLDGEYPSSRKRTAGG